MQVLPLDNDNTNTTIFVGNLDPNVTDEEPKHFFLPLGDRVCQDSCSQRIRFFTVCKQVLKKAVQIENTSIKLEEKERFALGTNSILNEMRQRVEVLVEKTSSQRQGAVENEQELSRVKQDFESLKSYVSSLISVRETLLSSEKQFQTIERHFERSV